MPEIGGDAAGVSQGGVGSSAEDIHQALELLGGILAVRAERKSKRWDSADDYESETWKRCSTTDVLFKIKERLERALTYLGVVSQGPPVVSVTVGKKRLPKLRSATRHILESYLSARTPDFEASSVEGVCEEPPRIRRRAPPAGRRKRSESIGWYTARRRLVQRRQTVIGRQHTLHGVPLSPRPNTGLYRIEEIEAVAGIDWDWDLLDAANADPNFLISMGLCLARTFVAHESKWPKLMPFLEAVQNSYLQNAYHNSTHAAAAAHQLLIVSKPLGFLQTFSSNEKVAMIAAAISHDIGHPGRTNAFLITTQHEIAKLYNDVSVLENFHAFQTFRLLQSGHSEVFAGVPRKEWTGLRQRIVELILATDMKMHFDYISRFEAKRRHALWSMGNACDAWQTCSMAMKVADIGHACLDWTQHYRWTDMLLHEFYAQADAEAWLGLPPTCADRSKHHAIPRQQAGYFSVIVRPLVDELATMDTEGGVFRMLSANLDYNTGRWKELEGSGETAPAPEPAGHVALPPVGDLRRMQLALEPVLRVPAPPTRDTVHRSGRREGEDDDTPVLQLRGTVRKRTANSLSPPKRHTDAENEGCGTDDEEVSTGLSVGRSRSSSELHLQQLSAGSGT